MSEQDWVTGSVVLSISGEPVEMELTVPAFPVKPQRMLPIFQQMTSAVVGMCASTVESEGLAVSCKAGCGACCRQAVPISEVEAYHLAEIVNEMPEPRRAEIRRRFASALEHFRKIGWFDKLVGLKDMSHADEADFSPKQFMDTVLSYFHENIACPFLEDESCSIHPDRPLICREYLVTSPAANCSSPSPESIRRVPIFLKPSKALLKVGRTANTEGISSLMLIEALDFVERHGDDFEEKSGERWAADLFGELANTTIPETSDAAEHPSMLD